MCILFFFVYTYILYISFSVWTQWPHFISSNPNEIFDEVHKILLGMISTLVKPCHGCSRVVVGRSLDIISQQNP